MSTAVPSPTFGPAGFVAPAEAAILAGVQADQAAAFGANLNPGLTTPQGQLAQSLAAIIGDANNQFLALANGVDPAFATGRMQDGIGRIYFLTRNPAQSTVVTATCSGLTGTVIPIGAQAQDQAGNRYLSTEAGTIPAGGSVAITFACVNTGPISCPIGYLNTIYQAIPGWDSITNAVVGVVGNNVESAADFEYRRQQTVAANSQGALASILGAVWKVPGVLDCYVQENTLPTQSGASVIGSISGTVLTVSAVNSGVISLGDMVQGAGVTAGTVVTSMLSGSGGVGTYGVSVTQAVGSATLSVAPGGVTMLPNSLYVAVYGGTSTDVAQAIWTKKSPGCSMNGNTTVVVSDNVNYSPPYPTYPITFEIPAPTPVVFSISMQASPSVPSGAALMIKNAVIAAFTGADGGQRARIGSSIFASRFYAGIAALGPWALIYSIQVGIGTPSGNSVLMAIDQIPTISAANISVGFV